MAEQVERLARDYEVHLYSNSVEDVDMSDIVWHRVPPLPGPHLLAYLWWFGANHVQRWWDRHFRGLRYDLLYTPGINCADADLISVHIVFAEFYEQVRGGLTFKGNPARAWLRLIHRRSYYALIKMLERWIYARKHRPLTVVSRKVSADLERHYGRGDYLPVIYHGWDHSRLSPNKRVLLRPHARQVLLLSENSFVLLLIGNDWKKKGLPSLLESLRQVQGHDVRVLVVGSDSGAPYASFVQRNGLQDRVQFLPLRKDVEFYYAAADAYVGPSLEDAFAMPPLEAMACGLPVIVSSQAGVSEIVTHGVDGLVLKDPTDSASLAQMIARLTDEPSLRETLGENAAATALQYTWERNATELRTICETVMRRRANIQAGASQSLV